MSETKDFRIQKYLYGEMDAEEIKIFEAELLINAELANELKLYKEVNGVIGNYTDITNFKKILGEVHHDYISKYSDTVDEHQHEKHTSPAPKSIKFYRRIYWSVAAVIIAILSFTIVMELISKQKSNDTLFAEYYQARESITVRSLDTTQNDPLKNCMKNYSQKNYKIALTCFNALQDTFKNSTLCIFFSGISYMETHDYRNAITSFNKLIDTKDADFMEASLWYSGLGYLKLNKTDSALIHFNELRLKDNLYKEQAEKIVSEMQN